VSLYFVPFLRYSASYNGLHLKQCELAVIQGHWKRQNSIDRIYDFLLMFHSNYGPVLHRFRYKARYWSKIAIFHNRTAFEAPVRSLSDYCRNVWYRKTGMVALPYGEKSLRIGCVYWFPYNTRHEHDRQTDKHYTKAYAALCVASRDKMRSFTQIFVCRLYLNVTSRLSKF